MSIVDSHGIKPEKAPVVDGDTVFVLPHREPGKPVQMVVKGLAAGPYPPITPVEPLEGVIHDFSVTDGAEAFTVSDEPSAEVDRFIRKMEEEGRRHLKPAPPLGEPVIHDGLRERHPAVVAPDGYRPPQPSSRGGQSGRGVA